MVTVAKLHEIRKRLTEIGMSEAAEFVGAAIDEIVELRKQLAEIKTAISSGRVQVR